MWRPWKIAVLLKQKMTQLVYREGSLLWTAKPRKEETILAIKQELSSSITPDGITSLEELCNYKRKDGRLWELIDPCRVTNPKTFGWIPTTFKRKEKKWSISSAVPGISLDDAKKKQRMNATLESAFNLAYSSLMEVSGNKLLKEDTLNVIIKAEMHVPTPGSVYEGVWHKGGFALDNIYAGAVVYYQIGSRIKEGAFEIRVSENVTSALSSSGIKDRKSKEKEKAEIPVYFRML